MGPCSESRGQWCKGRIPVVQQIHRGGRCLVLQGSARLVAPRLSHAHQTAASQQKAVLKEEHST